VWFRWFETALLVTGCIGFLQDAMAVRTDGVSGCRSGGGLCEQTNLCNFMFRRHAKPSLNHDMGSSNLHRWLAEAGSPVQGMCPLCRFCMGYELGEGLVVSLKDLAYFIHLLLPVFLGLEADDTPALIDLLVNDPIGEAGPCAWTSCDAGASTLAWKPCVWVGFVFHDFRAKEMPGRSACHSRCFGQTTGKGYWSGSDSNLLFGSPTVLTLHLGCACSRLLTLER